MSCVAIIPARGNSKRLPRKNLLPFNGVPLVVRAIRCAKEAGIFDRIIVSSEDDEINKLAFYEMNVGIPGRPKILSDDEVQTAAVVFQVLSVYNFQYDSFCVLNPTSPLRTAEQLRQAYKEFEESQIDCYISENIESNILNHDGNFLFWRTLPFLRWIGREAFPETVWTMQTNGIDINTQKDFDLAEANVNASTNL